MGRGHGRNESLPNATDGAQREAHLRRRKFCNAVLCSIWVMRVPTIVRRRQLHGATLVLASDLRPEERILFHQYSLQLLSGLKCVGFGHVRALGGIFCMHGCLHSQKLQGLIFFHIHSFKIAIHLNIKLVTPCHRSSRGQRRLGVARVQTLTPATPLTYPPRSYLSRTSHGWVAIRFVSSVASRIARARHKAVCAEDSRLSTDQ